MTWLLLLLAGLPYPFAEGTEIKDEIATRIPPPAGATRVTLAPQSFGDWLRHLPLWPSGTPVRLWNGQPKARQDVHHAVVALDIPSRDLQQCADTIMRLRAEWLWAAGRAREIRFHPEPGKKTELAWKGGRDRKAFARFMVQVFAQAGTASLAAEMKPLGAGALAPGDVLIQGGYPGHAVLVLDAAETPDGRRFLLLGQSYMPAQQFHVLRNLESPQASPWFDAVALDRTGIVTPEWRPFSRKDARRF